MDMRTEMKQHDLLAPLMKGENHTFVQAQGAAFTDDQGRGYVDLFEMCQVLGQNNQAYIQAMTDALRGITSGKVGFSAPKAELYSHFLKATQGDFEAIHLMSSGSEAVEWAFRLAKKLTGRTEVISFWNSIHGRTYLSASMSGLPRRKTGYGPLAPGVVLVPYPRCCECPHRASCADAGYPCLEYIKMQYTCGSAQDAAAIIVEPWQGARIEIAPKGWMEALGNGMHISAILTRQRPAPEALPAVSGGTGDEYLSCTAACQVFRQLEEGLLTHIQEVSALLSAELAPLSQREAILDIRCAGLVLAIEFRRSGDCQRVFAGLTETGFLLSHTEKCILCKPPYVITREEILKITKTIEIFVNLL